MNKHGVQASPNNGLPDFVDSLNSPKWSVLSTFHISRRLDFQIWTVAWRGHCCQDCEAKFYQRMVQDLDHKCDMETRIGKEILLRCA